MNTLDGNHRAGAYLMKVELLDQSEIIEGGDKVEEKPQDAEDEKKEETTSHDIEGKPVQGSTIDDSVEGCNK